MRVLMVIALEQLIVLTDIVHQLLIRNRLGPLAAIADRFEQLTKQNDGVIGRV